MNYYLSTVLFSDELLPICQGLEDERPLLQGLADLDSDERQSVEAPSPNPGTNRTKINPKVTMPGRKEEVYKSTLVSVLNDDPNLSHDRCGFEYYSNYFPNSE